MTKREAFDQIMQLWSQLKNTRSAYESGWKLITEFCSPELDIWEDVRDVETPYAKKIYDGTALSALNILSNGMSGYMASSQTKSFKITLENIETVTRMPYKGRVRQFMQDLESVFYGMINRSNFYEAVHQAFKTCATIGTVAMFPEKVAGVGKMANVVLHPKDFWIAQDETQKVDTLFRRISMSGKDIEKRWKDKLDDDTKRKIKESPYKEFDVLNAVLPREYRDVTKIDSKNKKYASYWLLVQSDKIILDESGFDEFPYVVWRWTLPPGQTYGWGPSHAALADVLRSNAINKSILEAAHLALYPALNVPSEKMGKLNLTPKGMNAYTDPSRKVMPINQIGIFPIARDREEAIEKAVRDHYMVDMFLMLNNTQDSKRTATEVRNMQAERAAVIGPLTTMTENHFFNPLFDLYFLIGAENEWLPVPPAEIWEIIGSHDLKIDYIGPMAQMQKQFYSQQSIYEPMDMLIRYGQFFPETLDTVDGVAFGQYLVNTSQLPQSILRDPKDIAAIQQQRAQQQQSVMNAENAQKNASAMKNMGDTNMDVLQNIYDQGGAV